jgi:GNAT superfamily N-acetyltransferase
MDEEAILRGFYEIMDACGMPRPPYEVWRRHATENAELWPIPSGNKLVGGVLWKGHTVHIAVHPDFHGRWITPNLMRAWRRCTWAVEIFATPLTSNRAACMLAERLGFELRGTQGACSIYVHPATPPNVTAPAKEEQPCHPH